MACTRKLSPFWVQKKRCKTWGTWVSLKKKSISYQCFTSLKNPLDCTKYFDTVSNTCIVHCNPIETNKDINHTYCSLHSHTLITQLGLVSSGNQALYICVHFTGNHKIQLADGKTQIIEFSGNVDHVTKQTNQQNQDKQNQQNKNRVQIKGITRYKLILRILKFKFSMLWISSSYTSCHNQQTWWSVNQVMFFTSAA